MPLVNLNTNVDISEALSSQLLAQLSKELASATGKPENYVMVAITVNKAMLFGGTAEPLAYLECKSIGLSPAQAKALAASLPKIITAALNIKPNRIYIEFSNCPAEFWGWNGSTFG
ncbi:MAG: phenylpyruvate tautomerase MIF-related protein [Methylococcaceae bacterium]|jgi:phenylpyruvate tautomerase PptA (4-oxalocrotonate tautomerase family)